MNSVQSKVRINTFFKKKKHKQYKLLVIPAIHNIEEIVKGLNKPIELTTGKYSNLEFRVVDNNISLIINGKDIKEFTNVWLSSLWKSRDIAYAVKLYLEHFNTQHTFVEHVTSKITDQVIFSLNNIPTPNTFFIDNKDFSQYVEIIENICGYPLIIKESTGSHGENAILVNNKNELNLSLTKLKKRKKYFFQKFIKNDFDWGILVVNGKVVSGERSYPIKNEFRNNRGATEVFEEIDNIPQEVKNIACKANNVLGLSWSRSDIVIDKYTGLPYLMEVNRFPGISPNTMEIFGAQEFLKNHLHISNIKIKNKRINSVLKSRKRTRMV